jgi:hypothetical protein
MTAIEKVRAEPCRCISCGTCGGTGYIPSWDGLDSDPCEDCNQGISETCDRCTLLVDLESK